MTIASVGGSAKTDFDSVTSATLTISYTPSGTGNLLTIQGGYSSGTTACTLTSCTDNLSNTWTVKQKAGAVESGTFAFLCFLENCPAGITQVTLTFSTNTTYYAVASVKEWSGVRSTGGVDQFNSANTGGTSVSTGAITNSNPNDLIIAVGWSDDNSTTAWGANAGYTSIFVESDTTVHTAAKAIYQIASSNSGPFSATMSYPPAAGTAGVAALIVSFSPPAAGGAYKGSLLLMGCGS